MHGEEIFAADVAAEIIVQATLRLPEPPTADEDVLSLTVLEFKQAVIAVLARYGARLTDDEPYIDSHGVAHGIDLAALVDDDADEHEIARLHDEGNPNHD